jgi:hypothetical protein
MSNRIFLTKLFEMFILNGLWSKVNHTIFFTIVHS